MKVIGLSGPSCSGKSTVSRYLRHFLPASGILYEDDFYLPDSEIPLAENGVGNWDCPGAFDLRSLTNQIEQCRLTDELPPANTREDGNNMLGFNLLSLEQKRTVEEFVHEHLSELQNEKVLFVDGIMLFHKDSTLLPLFDAKLALSFDRDSLKKRREARAGYATPDGEFWVDPPGYFDNIVWTEFEKHCAYLYMPPNGTRYDSLSPAARKLGVELLPADDLAAALIHVMQVITSLNQRPQHSMD